MGIMAADFPQLACEQEVGQEPIARRFARYWLLKLIARGGMGEVYLAATTGIEGAERPCVVKIIRREHAKDSSFLARFFDEARVQSQLQHPGVVQVFEAAVDENSEPYVVVEYVEGRNLGEVRTRSLQLSLRMSWADAAAVALATAEALAHVHERVDIAGSPLGIVHRDLSPQNIMLGYCGDVKLIDFGTARGQNRRCHTVSGVVFAKPGYVAPEVANGKSGDARVDLYALGVVLWELAAGRRFLQGDPAEHLAGVAKNSRNPPPIATFIGAPPRLDAILSKLVAFDPDRRYASAREAATDLAQLLSKAPSLSNGERGVRARIAQLMSTIYPAEPTKSRREFARLVMATRTREQEGKAIGLSLPPLPPSPCSAKEEVDDALLPGTRYRIERKIGQGAAGTVYEAEHIDLGRRVAIKVLSTERSISPDLAVRFRREARLLSRLSHPNLVALHDFGQASDGRLFCAMELLEGETLDQRLAREGALPWREALGIAMQVVTALKVAHHAGLVHLDLKPSNLFCCVDGTVKLLDFGLAKMLDEVNDGSEDKGGFALFGTPEYMAPEQVASTAVDARADIYAMGCVLYELCTGKLPFEGNSPVEVLDAKVSRLPERPRDRVPDWQVPEEVDRLIMRALERDPDRRTASASALLEAMHRALRAPGVRRQRKRLAAMAMVATCLIAAVILVVGAVVKKYPDRIDAAVGQVYASLAPQRQMATPQRNAQARSVPAKRQGGSASEPSAEAVSEDTVARADPTGVEPLTGACLVPAPAQVDPMSRAAISRDRAQRAVIQRNWVEAIEAARAWVAEEPTRQSKLFLMRILVHTHNCAPARQFWETDLGAEPAFDDMKALVEMCTGATPTQPLKAVPRGRAKGERSRVAKS